jgi:Family of unknown function (DUF6173)
VAEDKKTAGGATVTEAAVHATATPPYTVAEVHMELQDANAEVPAPIRPPATSAIGAPPAQQPHNPAQWMHERLVHQIIEFEKRIGPDHEVGGRFVEGPGSEPLHLANIASWGPDMILFMGQFPDGRKWELLQHYSQVSLLLIAVPKMTDEPRRIGFELMKNYRDQPHTWGDPES